MRFIRQHDHYRCGPVAIVNAVKLLGGKMTAADMKWFSEFVGCKPGYGVDPTALKKFARFLGLRITEILRPLKKDIDALLDAEIPVILNYDWKWRGETGRHYALFFKRSDTHYYALNAIRGETVSKIPVNQFKDYKRNAAWRVS